MGSAWIRRVVHGWRQILSLAAMCVPLPATSALLVYEPFDYPAPSFLHATPATGLNLAGTYATEPQHDNFQLRVSAPGLGYGNLTGAPATAGNKLTQLQGTTGNSGTVALAQPVTILPGQAIFFSALFTLDDSRNGNHLASIELLDEASGASLAFGESAVGVRAIRATARVAATGAIVTTTGNDRAFENGQTILLFGRYNNSPLPQRDRLELLGYDVAASHGLPADFDPNDPNTVLYQELSEADIDFERISAIRFRIRGADNNYLDELRIGSTLADVVVVIPEPGAWMLMLFGMLAVAAAARRSRRPAMGRC